jgi:hypothetical protein
MRFNQIFGSWAVTAGPTRQWEKSHDRVLSRNSLSALHRSPLLRLLVSVSPVTARAQVAMAERSRSPRGEVAGPEQGGYSEHMRREHEDERRLICQVRRSLSLSSITLCSVREYNALIQFTCSNLSSDMKFQGITQWSYTL